MAISHDPHNVGAMQRACRIATELLQYLADDPRVMGAFMGWCLARGVSPDRLRLAQHHPAERAAVMAALQHDPADAVERIGTFVREVLSLSLPWLPSLLLDTFYLWAVNISTGTAIHIPSLAPDEQSWATMPRGRVRLANIPRDVGWYYRVRVKHPPDAIATIANEYAQVVPRHNDAHSGVSMAIARVHECLQEIVIVRRDE